MSTADFAPFKEQFNLPDSFVESIDLLFDKLYEQGYIGIFKRKYFLQKLYDNIKEVYIGTNNIYDYKSGFYDASKKILYIKSANDVSATFLRVLYALTTTEIDTNSYITGYMSTKLRKDSYKFEYKNYGLNRAIFSNLVCRLTDSLPANIGMYTSYKTYTQDFLGYKIESPNNIYPIEGKLLSELCFALDINEELFYSGIFSKYPINHLQAILSKKGLDENSDIFKILDDISISYNTYNKLVYLSKKLNDNYLEFKKNVLNNDVHALTAERLDIEKQIEHLLINLQKKSDVDEAYDTDSYDLSLNLNEAINEYEGKIINSITKYQNILVDRIISHSATSTYIYASKLRQFNDMLLVKNEKLSKKIIDTIINKLLPKDEISTINLTVKIKYALIQSILSDKQFSGLSNNITFNVIPELINEETGSVLVLLKVNQSFARLMQIDDVNLPIEDMKISPAIITIDNFNYLLNSDYANMYVGFLEKIYTAVKNKYDEFKNISLNNLYMFEHMDNKYLIVTTKTTVAVLAVDVRQTPYYFKKLDVTEAYSLFEVSNNEIKKSSYLPTVYNK